LFKRLKLLASWVFFGNVFQITLWSFLKNNHGDYGDHGHHGDNSDLREIFTATSLVAFGLT
jgi:hypothetical protein